MGGNADPRGGLPVDLTKRVVAFVGSFDGVLHHLGTVPVNHNWEIIRELILLRSLVESKRAYFKTIHELRSKHVSSHTFIAKIGCSTLRSALTL